MREPGDPVEPARGDGVRARRAVRLNEKIPPEMVIASVDDPAYLADKLVNHFGINFPER
jgi:hypothetical protein